MGQKSIRNLELEKFSSQFPSLLSEEKRKNDDDDYKQTFFHEIWWVVQEWIDKPFGQHYLFQGNS